MGCGYKLPRLQRDTIQLSKIRSFIDFGAWSRENPAFIAAEPRIDDRDEKGNDETKSLELGVGVN